MQPRNSFLVLCAALYGCADVPVTADQLAPSGELRSSPGQYGFAVASARAEPKAAQIIELSTTLTSQDTGPFTDRVRLSGKRRNVDLVIEAAGLQDARQVEVRWIHGDQVTAEAVTLVPGNQVSARASLEVRSHQVGPWTVEVVSTPSPAYEPEVLMTRDFVVE